MERELSQELSYSAHYSLKKLKFSETWCSLKMPLGLPDPQTCCQQPLKLGTKHISPEVLFNLKKTLDTWVLQ